MNNERATPNYEFMAGSSQEIKFPFKNNRRFVRRNPPI